MTTKMLSCCPWCCLSRLLMLSLPIKSLTLPHPTCLSLLHFMHWTMGNHCLPKHLNMTGTMTMGSYTSNIGYTFLNLPNKTWYQPSMPARPADMVVYFAPSTCSNKIIGGWEWPPTFVNMLLTVPSIRQTKSTPIPPSLLSLPYHLTAPILSSRFWWTLSPTYPLAGPLIQSWS